MFEDRVSMGESRKSKVESRKSKVESRKSGIEEKPFKSTEAQRRASKKFSENNAQIAIRITYGMKNEWDEYARGKGESLRAFIIRSVTEQMKRDITPKVDLDKLLEE